MAYQPDLSDAQSRIRFAVQDTDDAAPLIAEQTYAALLALHNGVEARATVAVAEALLLRYAGEPDKVEVTGAVKVEWSQRLATWRALANGLRAELGLAVAGESDMTLRIGQFTRGGAVAVEFGG